ncbi:multidrug transporter [Vibrio sp. 10N.286.49.B3]|uniref:HlyD family secretion protein n=1 Tax=Vibrio sp. 10N.286.49.B3 TaxID=1880855 RepID=UPI000C82EC14|nr:HlyD family secretion protein [Vibrio sp. 10N.286.49.B3]PMH42151.1 multidrug transporter [Vibrio sp. 10N.286.49.B3]
MMNKAYQWVLYFILGLSALFAAFLVTSDNLAPFTTQAQLHIPTSRIAAEVSAPVVELMVKNGQQVKKGELLVRLDATRYQLAFTQAKAALVEAEQNYQANKQHLNSARATLHQREQEAMNAERKVKRNDQLITRKLISQEALDDSRANLIVGQQAVVSARASVAQIEAELAQSSESGALAIARANVELTQLDLQKTTIVAPVDGVISNLNLNAGTYVNAGSPVLFLVDRKHAWINADFNEKGITQLAQGTDVRIVFDALPGEIYQGKIQGKDLAIYDASSDNSGLARVVNDDRWIRDQQKVRTQVTLPQIDDSLFSGSKVSVMVISDSSIWGTLGNVWMNILARLRYLV